jgi:hypothetical protein
LVDRDRDRAAESRRILERISREAHAGDASLVSRAAKRARDHVSATDADGDDWIEQWGTRIGRVLGLAICAGLLVWLVMFLLRGA